MVDAPAPAVDGRAANAIDRGAGLGILGAKLEDAAASSGTAAHIKGETRPMPIFRPTAALLATTLLTTPALALEVSQSVEVQAPPEQVWDLIGGFCSIAKWHPVVKQCTESQQNGAAMRKLTTVDGAVIVEKRVQYSDEGMSYTYVIVDSPLPVSDYTSTIAVMGMGEGSMITWSGDFAAKGASDAKAVEVITGIYQAGLNALKDRLR